MSTSHGLLSLYRKAEREVPAALTDWPDRLLDWYDAYEAYSPEAMILEIDLGLAVFAFDQVAERVVLAYAISTPALHPRDKSRMRGFPSAGPTAKAVLGDREIPADRGHFLGHASGGPLDINLFPQSRSLNQGKSVEGQLFRSMEKFVAKHPGTFFFHRARYQDATWFPTHLEYGVLKDDREWWVERFDNRS
jgi:hypothetical protein